MKIKGYFYETALYDNPYGRMLYRKYNPGYKIDTIFRLTGWSLAISYEY